jgi:hypothetical protein
VAAWAKPQAESTAPENMTRVASRYCRQQRERDDLRRRHEMQVLDMARRFRALDRRARAALAPLRLLEQRQLAVSALFRQALWPARQRRLPHRG